MQLEVTSFNPYERLEVVVADDPQSLVKALRQIRHKVIIIQITSYGTKQAAYIMGDIEMVQVQNKQKNLKSIKGV